MEKTRLFNRLSVQVNILIIFLIIIPTTITALYFWTKLDMDLREEILSDTYHMLKMKTDVAENAIRFSTKRLNSIIKHVQVHLNSSRDMAMICRASVPVEDFFDSQMYGNIASDMKTALLEDENFLKLTLINTSGREMVHVVRANSGIRDVPPKKLQDDSRHFYFQQTMKIGREEHRVFTPMLYKKDGKISLPHTLVMQIARKVYLDNGELFGIVVFCINANMLFGDRSFDKNPGFLVIDNQGNYLSHWDKSLLYGKQLGHDTNMLDEEPELGKNLARQNSRIHFDPEIREYRVWRKVFYDSGYMVFMERIPESSVVATWEVTLREGSYVVSAIMIASLLLILLILNRMLRPLVSLKNSIIRLEHGDLDARVKIQSDTEIGVIGAAFNKMAEEIQKKTSIIQMEHNITVLANEATTVDESILICMAHVCNYTQWEIGHAFIPDDTGILVSSNLWYLKHPEKHKRFRKITELTTFRSGVGLPGTVYKTGEPAWIIDTSTDPNFPRTKILNDLEIETGFAFPVLERKKVVAVLEFFSSQTKEPDDLLINAVKNMATQLGRVTERKRLDEKIRMLSLFPSENPNPVMRFSREGMILFKNPRSEILCRELDCEEGRPVPAEFRTAIDRCLKTEKPVEFEMETNGRMFNIVITPTGDTGYVNLYGRDITNRKLAEQALKKSETEYRNLFEHASDAIYIADADTRQFLMVNKNACNQIGYTKEELLNLRIEDVDIGCSVEEHVKSIMKLKKSESAVFETKNRRKDGTIIDVEISSRIINYSGKSVIQSFVRNITERKRIEEKLQVAAMVINGASEGIAVTDKKAIVESVNPAFTCITGYEPEEVIGKSIRTLKSDRHDRKFYKNMWDSIINDDGWEGEIWNRRKSGEAFLEHITITAIKDSDGSTTKYACIFQDITDKRRSEDEIEYKAYHDALTGLPNRQLFMDRLTQAIARAKRSGSKFAILFLDLDGFKHINDNLGHDVGDLLLRGVSVRLVGCAREEDTVSRLGGDEFTIIVEDIQSTHEASEIARRTVESLAEPFMHDGDSLFVSTSVGIALFPDNGSTTEELLKSADLAMYSVKDQGKNNFRFFSKPLNEKAVKRRILETSLRNAMNNNELVAYYQPIISLKTGLIAGAEALVRWRREENRIANPDEFLHVAEEAGLITMLDEWMLCEVCDFITKMKTSLENQAQFSVSVNLSALDLEQPDIVSKIIKVIDSHKVDPGRIVLEVKENDIIENMDTACDILGQLGNYGTSVLIDDFGSGYTSLSYLMKLRASSIKIDRVVIREIPGNKVAVPATTAIVSMAREIGLHVIAEGVETDDQLKFLQNIECEKAQGFLISLPLDQSEMENLILNKKSLMIRGSDSRQATTPPERELGL